MRRVTRVRTGLSAPRLLMGVEEQLLVLNYGAAAVLVAGPGFLWYPLVALAFHLFLRGVSKKEPLAARIYMRYALQADTYEPWPSLAQRRGSRPEGFGRRERLM